MNIESYQGLHSLGTGEPVCGALFQDLCQEVFTGFSGLPLVLPRPFPLGLSSWPPHHEDGNILGHMPAPWITWEVIQVA